MSKKIKFIALAAVSLDGKIALHKKHKTDWTSKEDKKEFYATMDKADLIIVGRQTFELAKKSLNKRHCLVFTRSVRSLVQVKENLHYLKPSKSALQKFIKAGNYQTVIILGGTKVYDFCLKHDFLDELHLTIEPVVFGKGLDLFSQKNIKNFKLISVKKLNSQGSLLLRYQRLSRISRI